MIAVTVARTGTAKRGLSAAVAVALASAGGERVCVLDMDLTARDVGMRFDVVGPSFVSLARLLVDEPTVDLTSSLARDAESGCWVVPAGPAGSTVDSGSYLGVIERLCTKFDYLVIDTPAGFASLSRPVDRVGDSVDVLLVASTSDADELSVAAKSVRATARAQITGEVPTWLDVRLVITEGPGTHVVNRIALDRRLQGIQTTVLPRLWGRGACSALADGAPSEPFSKLLADMGVIDRAPSAG